MTVTIPEYDNYLISDRGVIYSLKRWRCRGGIVKPFLTENGYFRVSLVNAKGKKTFYLHRLVAGIFILNPDNKPCINHKDGDKTNNAVENLEWCTYSENMKHAISNGLNRPPALAGSRHPNRKLSWDDVLSIRTLHSQGVCGAELGRRFGVTKEQIYNIVSGKQWKGVKI